MVVRSVFTRLLMIGAVIALGVGLGWAADDGLDCAPHPHGHHGFPTKVFTRYGVLKGFYNTPNTVAWTGVPFAKPPVDDLRWKAPQDPEPWDGERDATQPCVPCAQLYTAPNWSKTQEMIGSEDCLYLSIYRPRNPRHDLPVYVYMHGGANHFGSANDYDGSTIADKSQMVVVIVQQRLGPLGWFAHPALRHGENPLDDSGNFGTLDNLKALQWVRRNIRAFGGNPRNVTITGESAGAHNVMNMVVSPLARGLFHRAMSQSGGMLPKTVAEGEAMSDEILIPVLAQQNLTLAQFKAWSLEEQESYLRGLDAGELWVPILHTIGYMTFDAFQDGHVIPGSVTATIRSGDYNRVPIILGANKSESKAFMPLYGPMLRMPWANLIGVLEGVTPSIDSVLPTDFDKHLYQTAAYYGSRNWRAKFVDERARALKEQQERVYAYQFNWGEPGSGPTPFNFVYGAMHTLDIPFFFGEERDVWEYAFTPETDTAGRQALSDLMMKYLANFARTGNPNGCGLPRWEKWSNEAGAPKAILFDADAEQALVSMSTEEVSILDEMAKLEAEIATWGPYKAYGPIAGAFQWQMPE